MVREELSELFESYLQFCRFRRCATKHQTVDLRRVRWFYPMALLPLGVLIKKSKDIFLLPPENNDVQNYLQLIVNPQPPFAEGGRTYQPMATLPPERKEAERCLRCLYSALDDGRELGGENSMKYLFGELVDNIYEHSFFENAVVMAQNYSRMGFAEVCFYDDGISIAGSFRNDGMDFDDMEAIARAVNGLFTKDAERGFGLCSTANLCTNGFNGKLLIISGSGGLHMEKGHQKGY